MTPRELNPPPQTTMISRVLGKTGLKLSILGMGGSGYGNVYGWYSEEEAIRTLRKGLDNGINYIDTAYWYGQGKSESFLGRALHGVKRENFIIGTKVGRYEQDYPRMFDFSSEMVTRSAHSSLKRLQLDHIDILQIHDVEFAPTIETITSETLPALQRLKEQGLCKFIGITGYPLSILQTVCERSAIPIDCILSYCRLALNDTTLTHYFHFFKSRNIGIINASPVGMGLLTPNRMQEWHPASIEIKTACQTALRYCEEQGVNIAKLAINYSTSFEEVSTTLVSMIEEETLSVNWDAAVNPLTEHEAQVRNHILKEYFTPIRIKHWEGTEIKKYHEEMSRK